jgi:hypothetical protein
MLNNKTTTVIVKMDISFNKKNLFDSYLDETLKNVVLHSVATALASIVFPVPLEEKNMNFKFENILACYSIVLM